MAFEEFGSLLAEICSHTSLAPGRPVLWTVIANPKAGGFTIKFRWRKHKAMLDRCVLRAKENPLREGSGPSQTALREGGATGGLGLIPTREAGHAGVLTGALIKEAGSGSMTGTDKRPFYLIITAGGDGTSLEVMTSLFHAPPETLRDFAILRLPMGTGNDGSDSWYLDKALELLLDPVEVVLQRAIRLSLNSGKGPFLAFNILSVGIDAYVTHMTNKMKGKLPGDSYKLWVDLAALFYDLVHKVGPVDVRSHDGEGKEVKAFNEKLLFLAVGESGRRTYGSHKLVLPDERNICFARQMPIYRKLLLKELLTTGKHIHQPETMLWNGHRVEFSPMHPILAQMDGETVLLEESDYPAVIELTEPVIPILKKTAGD